MRTIFFFLIHLAYISGSYASSCDISSSLIGKHCSDEYFEAKNKNDLSIYLADGKFKDGKLLNLKIDFNIKEDNIEIATPCNIQISKTKTIISKKHGICIKSKEVHFEGQNVLEALMKGAINLEAASNLTIEKTLINTLGAVSLNLTLFNPLDNELFISKASIIKAGSITIDSKSNLVLEKPLAILSNQIVLNGGNCELFENKLEIKKKFAPWLCQDFRPDLKYEGSCKSNPVPSDFKILTKPTSDQNKFEYTTNAPANYSVGWIFDEIGKSHSSKTEYHFQYPGVHHIKAAIISEEGFFRRLSILQNVKLPKITNGQIVSFQFFGTPSLIKGKIGGIPFSLESLIPDMGIYAGKIVAKKGGDTLLEIPTLGYSSQVNIVLPMEIKNPLLFITAKLNTLKDLVAKIDTNASQGSAAKLALEKNIDFLQTEINKLDQNQLKDVSNILNSNLHLEDVLTSELDKNTLKIFLNNIFLAEAYAQSSSVSLGTIEKAMLKFLVWGTAKKIGLAMMAAGAYAIYQGNKLSPKAAIAAKLAGAAMILGGIILHNIDLGFAQETMTDIYAPKYGSFTAEFTEVFTDKVASATLYARFVKADTTPLFSYPLMNAVSLKEASNEESQRYNEVNRFLIIPIGLEYVGLRTLFFPSGNIKGILEPEFVSHVSISRSQFGTAKLTSFEINNGKLQFIASSPRTQDALFKILYFRGTFPLFATIETLVKIHTPPKAVINYTTDNLKVNFSSQDPSSPSATGLTYHWNFGDGTSKTTTSKSLEHVYSTPGKYIVSLRVIDSEGLEDEISTEINLVANSFSAFVRINVLGTYLFVDTEGGFQENGHFLKDVKVSPSQIDLTPLYDSINLREGDMITVQAVGTYIPGPTFPENAKGVLAVFTDSVGNFILPGPGTTAPSYRSPSTYPRNISTDIGQDFLISEQAPSEIRIPTGAKYISLSPIDTYYADNVDPNGDYGVSVKITILRSPPLN